MKGYVYILSNPAYKAVKIGKAQDPKIRLKQLNASTGVLWPFRLEAVFKSQDYTADEYAAHQHLSDFRVRNNKEFFRLSPKEATEQLTQLFNRNPKWSRIKHIEDLQAKQAAKEAELVGAQKQAAQRKVANHEQAKRIQQQQSRQRKVFACVVAAIALGMLIWFII